jgi:4-methyl-5(b-hydroxyethyl)-thiazole monophosphate biosynthesis
MNPYGIIIVSNYVEDMELVVTLDLLRRADIHVNLVSYNNSNEIVTSHDLFLRTDSNFEDLYESTEDFIIIPGGPWVNLYLDKDEKLVKLIKKYNKEKKGVYAICAAPQFLGKAGILKNKKYVSFPGCDKYLDVEYKETDKKCVVSSNIITSKGAGTAIEFAYEIIKKHLGEEKAEEVLKNIQYY